MPSNTAEIIADALDDAGLSGLDETPEVTTSEPIVEETPTVVEEPTTEVPTEQIRVLDKTTQVEEDTTPEAVEPTVEATTEDKPTEVASTDDDVFKQFGISDKSVTGRENRIPHSRVKQMVDKTREQVTARVTKELEAKFQPRVTELETKTKDYEGRLEKVAQFEYIMEKEPKKFLGMISQLPAYREFFDYVSSVIEKAEGQPAEPATPTVVTDPSDPMPSPNKQLADGSKVYDMEGLQSLIDWTARNVQNRVEKSVEQKVNQRLAPLDEQRKRLEQAQAEQEYIAKVMPVIDQQIAKARTWPNFNELEPQVIEILKAEPTANLEYAYMKAYQASVVPRLTSDRNKVRSEVLAEINRKPARTTAPVSPSVPRQAPADDGRGLSTADVIRRELEKLR